MSKLHKSLLKAKTPLSLEMGMRERQVPSGEETDVLVGLRGVSPLAESDSSSASSESSTGTVKPSPSRHLFARPRGPPPRGTSHEPLPWTSFFSQELHLKRSSDEEDVTFHAYITPPGPSGPLFVTHHGAGSSGLSFAALGVQIRKWLPQAGMLSFDARGHGETVVESKIHEKSNLDMALTALTKDMISVVRLAQEAMKWSQLPNIILVGHSLGGAVITGVAKSGELGDKVLGYAVLDVVEGSAIDALESMQNYLATRPAGFSSVAEGITWHLRSRTIRDLTSARVSVPGLLKHEPHPHSSSSAWIWRTDLAATQPFWEGWFVGLSKKFLAARGGKLLMLAGTDRLDKELMIGQMQGKYQLEVILEAGHFIHEDFPERTAVTLVEFYKRNDRSTLVLPPKVADMIKNKQPV